MAEILLAPPPVAPPVEPPKLDAPPAAPVAPSDWRATLPEDVRGHKSLEKFKDPGALVRSYVEMEKYQGRSVVIPGADATPDARQQFWAKIDTLRGVPEKPDAYTITPPEGLTFDDGLVGDFRAVAHRLKLNQEQVAGLTHWFTGSPVGNPQLAGESLRAGAVTQLKAAWGGAYAHNLQVAAQGAKQIGGPKIMALLESSGLGNHPDVVEFFWRLGKDYAEDGAILTDAQTGGILGPDDARQKIAAIRADKAHPFHRGDKEATAEMARLYELLTAGA